MNNIQGAGSKYQQVESPNATHWADHRMTEYPTNHLASSDASHDPIHGDAEYDVTDVGGAEYGDVASQQPPAAEAMSSSPGADKRRGWYKTAVQVALIAGAVFAGRSSLADHYRVPTGSMENTIMPGDRVLVNKTAYGVRVPFTDRWIFRYDRPERGEVVTFEPPDAGGTTYIKRVVAIAGDVVALSRGHLTVNGEPMHLRDAEGLAVEGFERFGDRLARLNLSDYHTAGNDFPATIVPTGMVMVIGDHRGASRDSRYFGFIREDEIEGRAVGIFYRRDTGLTWNGC